MQLLNYIILDFSRPNVAVLDYAVQGDEYSRGVVAQLVGGSQAWTPPAGAVAFIEYVRPDGVNGLYDALENGDAAVTLDGSTATLLFSAHALQVSGALAVALRFVDVAGRKLRSFEFTVNVKRELVSDDDVTTDPYYNILSEQIADVLNAAASLTGMTVSNTTLPPGSAATATITGGSGGIPYNILFGIPRGDTGPTGPQGPKGDPGAGSPSDALPLMDGTASAGDSDLFARGDHVHPADTSRAAAETHNLETYTSVTQLGLTAGSATIASAWTALPSGAMLITDAGEFSAGETPATNGAVEFCKSSVGWVMFHGTDGADSYSQNIINGSPSVVWSILQSGVLTLTGSAKSSSSGSGTIVFSRAFRAAPTVVLTVVGSTTGQLFEARPYNITTTGFNFAVVRFNGTAIDTGAYNVRWLAVGSA